MSSSRCFPDGAVPVQEMQILLDRINVVQESAHYIVSVCPVIDEVWNVIHLLTSTPKW